MISHISDGYLNWLMDKISDTEGYSKLFKALASREFIWTVQYDDNRAKDGLVLREKYCNETGKLSGLEGAGCTVLEMMIGLSIRVGEEILWDGETDYISIIFWEMIHNLRLNTETDNNFYDEYVEDRIDIFLNREYDIDGEGALFRPSHFYSQIPKKWAKLEIWYQMQNWLNDNF